MNYLIIGNGIAGVEAAQTIRRNDSDSTITIISQSKHLHYYRPRIIEYLANKVSLDQITIYKDDFYIKNNINNILDTKIVSIEPDSKQVIDSNGNSYTYDKLLMATGSAPFVPPIEGVETQGIFTLKGASDADNILSYCENISDVIVIGGGLLGLETANSLSSIGKNVTVIELAKWLLPRQLDKEGGDILQEILMKKGILFQTDASVSQISSENNKVTGITLKSGKEINGNVIIISAGIKPEVHKPLFSIFESNRGIKVSDTLATSIRDIYAAGDLVEHNGIVYGLWDASKEQGKIAGLNMCGINTQYVGTTMASQLKITGIDLYSAGNIYESDAKNYVLKDKESYLKFLIKDEQPVGAIVLGKKDAIKLARNVMNKKNHHDDFIKLFSIK